MRFPSTLTALVLACGAVASGQVINVDFDEFSETSIYGGLAAAPDPAGAAAQWNRATGSSTSTITANNLKNSTGTTTGVGISVEINGSFLSDPSQQELGPSGIYQDLMEDYVYLSSPVELQVVTKNGSIFGLDPGQLYDVYLYAQGDNFLETYSPGQNTLFTINGISKQTSWDGIQGGDGFLVDGIEYVRFRVAANAGGVIGFTWANVVSGTGGNVAVDLDGNNSRFAVINGLQIVAVPEPSAALLGSFAVLGLLRRRR
jgi:hypothetical protein